MGNPVGVPPATPPTVYPNYYDNLTAINLNPDDPSGINVITADENSVVVSGISDGVGETIVTYLVDYQEGGGEPNTGGTVVAVSNAVVVTDLGSMDANSNEIGTFTATLPTAGLAPGIYIADSIIEFQGTDGTVYEDGGAGATQIVSVEPAQTQNTALQLSGTNAEISTDGRYLVYTAINEYNEPETTGDVYERDLQTGAEIDLTATGASPTGTFAVNHPQTGGNYQTFTSTNGAYTFGTINDFDLNPDGGGYNPLPVVTDNATGDQSVIGGIGGYKYFVGAAMAASNTGDVVLSAEQYPVLYHATGAAISENPDPQIYITYLNAAPVLTINPLNGNNQYASNATSVTVTGNSSAIGQTVEIDLGATGNKAGTAVVSALGVWSFTFNPSAISTTSLFIEASVMGAAGTPAQASETATATAPIIGPDTFSDTQAASSGIFNDRFIWSDSNNWSAGLPVDGDSATLAGSGIDDLASLTLTTLAAAGEVAVVAGSLLSVSTLSVNSASGIEADTDFGTNVLVDVLIGTIIGSNALIEAEGTGASTQILEASEPAEFYQAADGGRLILDTLAAGSTFGFDHGTLALALPGATTAAHIEGLAAGDVLELPGSAVNGVTYGADSLTIATSSGSYDFSDVTYGGTLNGYSAAMDTSTGLEAITFTSTAPASDVFQHGTTFSGGFLNGSYLWEDGSNWVGGQQPQDGDSVTDALQDGIASGNLSLASLSLVDGGGVDWISGNLTVGTIMNNGILIALDNVVDGSANANLTIALDSISLSGSGGIYMADGPGAYLIDNAAVNPGGAFVAEGGGFVELNSAPGLALLNYSEPLFAFFNGPGTIALTHPGATIAASLGHVTPDDVLELPGNSVSAVHFGTGSLTVTTSAGTYDFTNVSYDRPVTGYTAAIDPGTGLEAITFTGPSQLDVFTSNVVQNTQDEDGEFFTDANNWSNGVPLNGDAVQITAYTGPGPSVAPQDANIADLSLSSMSVLSGAELLISHKLTVGTLTIDAGANVYDQDVFIVDGTTLNDGKISTDPSSLVFEGAVTGNGTITIGSGSDVTFDGAVAAGQTVDFLDSTGTLTINDPAEFLGMIEGTGVTIVSGNTVSAAAAAAAPMLTTNKGTLVAGATADKFTLNLGSVVQGGPDLTAVLDLSNGASAPADPLGGSFSILGGTEFDDSGFASLSGIAAGGSAIAGSISLGTGMVGSFSETIVVSPIELEGGNTVALAPQTVTVIGTITAKTGTAQGDVHLVTFDGLHYDFQATGDFVLARSTLPGDSFQVQMQAVQYQQKAGTSVAEQYAAQLGSDRIAFTAGPKGAINVSVDGVADAAIGSAGARQVFAGGTLVALSANNFVLDWNTGESMHVTSEFPRGQTYLDASVKLPSQDGAGSVQGLMGTDSGQANDFTLPDGTVLHQPLSAGELLGAFANAWRVAPDASILNASSTAKATAGPAPSFEAMSFVRASSGQPVAETSKDLMLGNAASSHFMPTVPGVIVQRSYEALGTIAAGGAVSTSGFFAGALQNNPALIPVTAHLLPHN